MEVGPLMVRAVGVLVVDVTNDAFGSTRAPVVTGHAEKNLSPLFLALHAGCGAGGGGGKRKGRTTTKWGKRAHKKKALAREKLLNAHWIMEKRALCDTCRSRTATRAVRHSGGIISVHCSEHTCVAQCAALPAASHAREALIDRLSLVAPSGSADGSRHKLPAGTTLFHGVSDGKFGWAELRDFSYVSNNLNPPIGAGIGEKSWKVRNGEGKEEFVPRLFEFETKRGVELVLNNEGGHGKKIAPITDLDARYGGANDGYIGSAGEEELRLRGRMIDNYVLARSHFFPAPGVVEVSDGSDITGSSSGQDVEYARWEPADGFEVETLAFTDRLFNASLLRQVHDAIDVNPALRRYADSLMVGLYHLVRRGVRAKTYVAFEENSTAPPLAFFKADALRCHDHPNITRRVAAFLVTSKEAHVVLGGGPLTKTGEARAFEALCKLWLGRVAKRELGGFRAPEPIELSVPYGLVRKFVGKIELHYEGRYLTKERVEVKIDVPSAFSGGGYPTHSAIANGSDGQDRFYTPLYAVPIDPSAPDPIASDPAVRYDESAAPLGTLLRIYNSVEWRTRWGTQAIIRHAILIRSTELLDHALKCHMLATSGVVAMDAVMQAMSDLVLTAYYPDGARDMGADAVWLASSVDPGKWFAENEAQPPTVSVKKSYNCGSLSLARLAHTLTSLFTAPPRSGVVLVDLLTTPNNELNLAVAGELCSCPDADWEAFRSGQTLWNRFKVKGTKWIHASKEWDANSTRDRRIQWIKAVLKRQDERGGVPWSCRLDRDELVPKNSKELATLGTSEAVSNAEYEELLRRSSLTVPEQFPDTSGTSYEKIRILVRHFRSWERGLPAGTYLSNDLLRAMLEFGGKLEEVILRNYDGFATDRTTPARALKLYKDNISPPASTWVAREEAEVAYGGKIGYLAEIILESAESKRGESFLKEVVAFLRKLNAVAKTE